MSQDLRIVSSFVNQLCSPRNLRGGYRIEFIFPAYLTKAIVEFDIVRGRIICAIDNQVYFRNMQCFFYKA